MSVELLNIIENASNWKAPVVPTDIPHGDMPGDKVEIKEVQIGIANKIFSELLKQLKPVVKQNSSQRAVLTVCGGSGVGKSGIASLISFYLNQMGIGSYTLSGDNYPHRIPEYNDAERLRIFRESGLKGMIAEGTCTKERLDIIHEFQCVGDDANTAHIAKYDWYKSYIRNGRKGLESYLGTTKEIGFDEVESIIKQFKNGADKIWLKRMGRTDTQLWYEEVDFSEIQVLLIEWTHGNSDNYSGVDIPILLNSTPQETLAYRMARNRDGATDSPFTTMVLEIEQALLEAQAHKAKIIVSKSGELLTYDAYSNVMEAGKKEGK
jgi:alpha-galactosidase